jgi:hypothetical protein
MSALPTPTTPASARYARPAGRTALLLGLVGALVTLRVPEAAGGATGAEVPLEQAVKAAYVYNFVKFVTWPAESPLTRAPALTIGILDDDPLADAVDATVRDRRVEGRPLAVRRFHQADEVVPCAVLFVGRAMSGQLPQILDQLRGWPVLTVSDAEGFTSQGGVIGLFLEDNRVRFEVGVTAAQEAGLQVSSKLLRLSRPAPGRPCPTCAVSSGREH